MSAITDSVSLKASLNASLRKKKLKALLLISPLLLFLTLFFFLPIADMLFRSVNNPELQTYLPRTSHIISEWQSKQLPDELYFRTLATDLKEARKNKTIGKVATRLNHDRNGFRSLIIKTGREIETIETESYKEALLSIDKRWGDIAYWRVIQVTSKPYTPTYYLHALDAEYNEEGEVAFRAEELQIHQHLFIRTYLMSFLITFLTILIGYPIAYLLATLPPKYSNLLMILVILPFWTSLLVRTSAWIVILQQQGVINDILVWLNFIDTENRIQMIYNQAGTIIAMTHILLPFMILPIYSVMKGIAPSFTRAAQSLGAHPFKAFFGIYFPMSLPGIGAGSLLVFILAIGYYITPALVGGQKGQLISNIIAFHMNRSLNWGLASALGCILLVSVLALYWIYNRLIGIDKIKLG